MASWYFIWLLFMLVVVMPSLGYGRGYRLWGSTYPRYFQRRRGQQAGAAIDSVQGGYAGSGWRGDVLGAMILIAACWAVAAYFWR